MSPAGWRRAGAAPNRRVIAVLIVLGLLAVTALVMSAADSRGTFDGTKDAAALRPGDCVALPEAQVAIRELTVLACDETHDGEVVAIVDTERLGGQGSTSACARALVDYADPERLTLSGIEPRSSTVAVPVGATGTDPPVSYRCIADLRTSPMEPRSLRAEP